ncbi:MAG: hypothetical protein F6K53_07640 [Moorea sp. SIO4A1]|uniref:hypothetical protein n=1 Tax=Moorena sp. SIO4A1 TaxID=2607835 RepID=UPI00144DDBC8|nr:hypothetical protein [Moorena sp. SIO4A1]NEQ57295.1 hypothetical protein [Moorena sp. SIO4A1]
MSQIAIIEAFAELEDPRPCRQIVPTPLACSFNQPKMRNIVENKSNHFSFVGFPDLDAIALG